MEDKVFKVLVILTIVLALATPVGYFLGAPEVVSYIMLFTLIVLIFATVRMYLKFGKDVMDLKCSVEAPKEAYKPGDTVNYTAEFTSKASFELIRFSVTLVSTYCGEKVDTVAHKEKKVHLENKNYVTGNSEKIQDSFKLPDNQALFSPLHYWKLVFFCEIKSALDKTETIEFIKNDKTLP